MESGSEKECTLLGALFQQIISDWKSSSPAWDDFVNKGCKLHSLLKSTTVAMTAFVDSIQKIADAATNTKGATKDVGSALTRICVRQKMVENKLKLFTNALMDKLLCPVQDKLEEWKKVANQLEKDHAKEYKRATNEIKKRNSDTLRLQKKARKGSKPEVHYQLNAVMHDVNERFNALEETEKSALRNLLVEERSRICVFANCLSPLLEIQVSMMNDVNHLSDLSADMANLCRNPKQLPTSTEHIVTDFISTGCQQSTRISTTSLQPSTNEPKQSSSPVLNDNRTFSSYSAQSIETSSALSRSATVRLRHNPTSQVQRHRRTSSGGNVVSGDLSSFDGDRLSSVSSRDSGFVSTGGADASQYSTFKASFAGKETNEQSRTNSFNGPAKNGHGTLQAKFSWKDWQIPGPYDSPHALVCSKDTNMDSRSPIHSNTADTTRHSNVQSHTTVDSCAILRSLDPRGSAGEEALSFGCDDPLPPPPPFLSDGGDFGVICSGSSSTSTLSSSPQLPLPDFIQDDFRSMTFERKNSSNSLQYSTSSGYSSRHTTPACSEDAIASHDTDPSSTENEEHHYKHRHDYEKFSTLPRNYHIGSSVDGAAVLGQRRQMSSSEMAPPNSVSGCANNSKTATIRRTPSSKYSSLRLSAAAPRAVKAPTVPSGGAVASLLSTFVPPPQYAVSCGENHGSGTMF